MGITGYIVEPDFFTGNPRENEITFYLADGGKNGGNIVYIKEVIVSIDWSKQKCVIVVPYAYWRPFICEIQMDTHEGMVELKDFVRDVEEWLSVRETWRQIPTEGKRLTVLSIINGNVVKHIIQK